MPIQRTGHVAIRVRDLDAARRFYGEILGMKLGGEIPGQGLFYRFNNYHHDIAIFKADDGATKSVYFADPDGIEFEVYCEVPEFDWRHNGMVRARFDIEGESAEKPLAASPSRAWKLPAENA